MNATSTYLPQEEEEHTKQVFQEFVATFEGGSKPRTWVRGGVVKTGAEGNFQLILGNTCTRD